MNLRKFTTGDTERKILDFVKALCAQYGFLLKKNILGKLDTLRAQRVERSHFLETYPNTNLFSVSSVINFESSQS